MTTFAGTHPQKAATAMTSKPTLSTDARSRAPRGPGEDDDHEFPPPFGPWKPKKDDGAARTRGGLGR